MTRKQSDIGIIVIDWLNTEHKDAIKALEEFKKDCQFDWRTLLTPFGPADGSGVWTHQRF